MEVQAKSYFVHISPIKVRDVARNIRGMNAEDAINLLRFIPRKAARLIAKTLQSAMANAENNNNLSAGSLVVAKLLVDEGPAIKRFKPVARGSAHKFKKRTTTITVVLSEPAPEAEAAKA
ncbi:MAG TPA: 50S ribosomal protein L22 [Opitutales bacterium]|nr:50S ribosomal protein L22 [Opitutales bacterium]